MRTARLAATTIAAAIVVALLWPQALGGRLAGIVVNGPSMEPTYESGDLVLVRRAADYDVGDVVAYRTDRGNVIHRIVGGEDRDGWTTRGDNRTEVDPWRPVSSDVIGRAWVHVPGVGAPVKRIADSVPDAAWIVLGTAVAVLGTATSRRRRRRRRATSDTSTFTTPHARTSGVSMTSHSRIAVLPVVVAGALALPALAALPQLGGAWVTPTTDTEVVEEPVRHAVRTSVRADASDSSTVYPDGVAGPVTAEIDEAAESAEPAEPSPDQVGARTVAPVPASAPPLVRRLLERIVVEASYSGPADGSLHLDVELTTSDGLRAALPGRPAPVPADETVSFTLAPAAAEQLLAELNALAGTDTASATVVVTPRVEAAESGDDVIRGAPLELVFGGAVIGLDGGLATVVEDVTTVTTTVPARTSVLGFTADVADVRVVGTAAVLALLALASLVLWVGYRNRPWDRVALVHRSLLVDVDEQTATPGHHVRVASMAELVRIARRDNRTILHQRVSDDVHRYLLPDADLTYEFVLAPDGTQIPPAGLDQDVPDDPSSLVGVVPDARTVYVATYEELVRTWLHAPGEGRLVREELGDGRHRVTLVQEGGTLVHEGTLDDAPAPFAPTGRPSGEPPATAPPVAVPEGSTARPDDATDDGPEGGR